MHANRGLVPSPTAGGIVAATRRFGIALVAVGLLSAVGAPVLAPHAVDDHFTGLQCRKDDRFEGAVRK